MSDGYPDEEKGEGWYFYDEVGMFKEIYPLENVNNISNILHPMNYYVDAATDKIIIGYYYNVSIQSDFRLAKTNTKCFYVSDE